MQVTENIHALKIPFRLSPRFVYVYLIYGEKICLIDSGILSSEEQIFEYIKKTGRDPAEITLLVQTHSHPDHIGASAEIKRFSGCRVAIHREEKQWIENIDLQFRERPTGTFYSFVKSAVEVDMVIRDGDHLDLGAGQTLKVIHTPGHSRGMISLWFAEEGALFSGDAIPVKGGVPIYADVLESIKSIRKLKQIEGVKVLLSSWNDPALGDRTYEGMDEGLSYFQNLHEILRKRIAASPSLAIKELCARVLKDLGLPETFLNPNVVASIEAHLKEMRHQDLLKVSS